MKGPIPAAVVGGGVAGIAAALELARQGRKVLAITRGASISSTTWPVAGPSTMISSQWPPRTSQPILPITSSSRTPGAAAET